MREPETEVTESNRRIHWRMAVTPADKAMFVARAQDMMQAQILEQAKILADERRAAHVQANFERARAHWDKQSYAARYGEIEKWGGVVAAVAYEDVMSNPNDVSPWDGDPFEQTTFTLMEVYEHAVEHFYEAHIYAQSQQPTNHEVNDEQPTPAIGADR